MDRASKQQLLAMLEERARRQVERRYRAMFPTLYEWQREFIGATARYSQCCLIAANRIGKTYTGTYIDAIHALGDYPDHWPGHAFDHATLIWCLGYSGEKTRDLLQLPLVGRKDGDKFEGGLIPASHIEGYESMTGTPNALRTLFIRQVGGGDVQAGTSRIQFWSYSQGQHALMGDGVDWFHVDEEPRDAAIYPQVLVRTATGDKSRGGRGILTFTPENGRTELVLQFMETPSPAQFCMRKGWDDAPHLSEKTKEDLLASFPAHQREMRTKGVPMLGHGRIYDLAEQDVTCAPFDIPPHFRVIDGMDFGWDHPQAQVQLAIDMDNEMFYVTRSWKKRHVLADVTWGAVKSWAAGVPTAWPADGLQTEKGSGKQQKAYYSDAGFNMLSQHATWPDGSNGVEAGLFEIRDLMLKGKWKFFAGQRDALDEFLQYHRDESGKIVKVGEDIMDGMRYAYMMRRYAVPFGEVGKPKNDIPVVIPKAAHFKRLR
jgi:phage terminase large subunit-like protein